MDQIYISKERAGFNIGEYVIIHLLKEKKIIKKKFVYNIEYLEPIKLSAIDEIFNIIDEFVKYDNIIITGSFLEKGFRFNDIDIMIVSEDKIDTIYLKKVLKDRIGIKSHIISIDNKALAKGFATDPLYKAMLSRCVARKRFIYKGYKINYKLLDLHLLKSRQLIENFDFLTGDEKYRMTRNLIAITQFIDKKKITKEGIDLSINGVFGDKTVQNLKENMLPKTDFLVKYKKIYTNAENKILKGIENKENLNQSNI